MHEKTDDDFYPPTYVYILHRMQEHALMSIFQQQCIIPIMPWSLKAKASRTNSIDDVAHTLKNISKIVIIYREIIIGHGKLRADSVRHCMEQQEYVAIEYESATHELKTLLLAPRVLLPPSASAVPGRGHGHEHGARQGLQRRPPARPPPAGSKRAG